MDAQINLPAKARRGNLLALLCNFNIWYSITLTCFFFYLVAQCNPPDVKVAQNWGAFISLQVATKGINSVIRSEEILSLFAWYQQTYETHSKETYQKIFVKYQERQNFYIKMIIQFLPRLLYVVAILYLLTPFLMGAGGLPTPLFWKGIPDTEISRWIYWTYFLAMVYVCYTVVTSIIAIDSFFAVSVIILAHRFKAIGDILNLLNYDGARDLKEDQEIIRDCYDMHLDLLKCVDILETGMNDDYSFNCSKIKVFQKYFNIYGLFHFISPIVVQVSVWYYITLSGINAMCIMLMVLMFLNVSMVCFFGQVLKELVSR